MNEVEDGDNGSPSIGRRRAIKTGVAAGTAAIVWAEPTIKGLTRRPAYAANGSADAAVFGVMISGTINADGSITNIVGGTGAVGDAQYNFISDVSNNGFRPRLRMINNNGANTLLSITSATYSAGPGGPAGDPFISNNLRRIRFSRLDVDGVVGTFTITVDILCTAP